MKQQLLTTLENSKNYTLAVLEAMPEKFYASKPAETEMNFLELMHHIAYGIKWYWDNAAGNKPEWNPPPVKKGKEEVVKYLEQAYDALKKTIEKEEKLTNDTIKGFYATIDHITHHRGQAVVYLRYKSIEPPEYTY
jgi:uncharacterized damage-inducible protein DinB